MKKFKLLPPAAFAVLVFLLGGCSNLKVLNPQGPVAKDQAHLIWWSLGFMLFIVVGVFTAFTIIVIRYRDRPDHPNHDPEQHGSKLLEFIWTAIPIIIIICLAVPTVKSIYHLEHPTAKTQPNVKPITIRVVSAQWKWIFVYPKQGIETVNYVDIPAGVPVKFQLTSAAGMTSFWVPQLGGQEYAMAGMMTDLILEASHPGTYEGKNTNFDGKEYTNMTFKVHSIPKQEFQQWAQNVKQTAPKLTEKKFISILQPETTGKMSFSTTHLKWVDFSRMKDAGYAVKHYKMLPKKIH
ncbi:MAG TPA: cytochrome aa3 quinol oxidase subunit II [Bacillales bacterium]|nr:cytochrome aa3 quinol oxidase subunit II [Bacillales bacterium]